MAINDPLIQPGRHKDRSLFTKMKEAKQIGPPPVEVGPQPIDPDELPDIEHGARPSEPGFQPLPFTRDMVVPMPEVEDRTSAFVRAFRDKYDGAFPHPNYVWDVVSSPLLKTTQDVVQMIPDIPSEVLESGDLLFKSFKPQMDLKKVSELLHKPQPRTGISLASTVNDPERLKAMIGGIEEEEQASWISRQERWVMEGVAKSIGWAGNLLGRIVRESREEMHENRDKLMLSTGIGYVLYHTSPGFRRNVDNVFDLANEAGEAMWDGASDAVMKGLRGWDEWVDRVGLATLTANMVYVDLPGREPALDGMWGAAGSAFVNWNLAQAKMLMAPSTMKQYIGIWKEAYKQSEGKTVTGNLLDISMDEHPLLYFALDMGFHAGVDYIATAGLGLATKPIKMFAAGQLTKYGLVDDVMGVVAKSKDASYIGSFLGLHRTPDARKLAAKLERARSPRSVAKHIADNPHLYSGSVRPGDLFLWKRAKAAIWSKEAASKHPLITSMFQLTPPRAINIWDENLSEYADWTARIFQLKPDRIKYFRNAVYKETDDFRRINLMDELIREGKKNLGKDAVADIKTAYAKGRDFILDPHSRDKTYLQMMKKNPKSGAMEMQEVSIRSTKEWLDGANDQLKTWRKQMKRSGLSKDGVNEKDICRRPLFQRLVGSCVITIRLVWG
jgi:hypothetical protein